MKLRQKLRRDFGKREILIWFLLNCQEIEELRSVCCEETDRARQARIDELSVHQVRNPIQIQDLQNKVNSLSDAREFCDLNQGVALE